MKWFKEWRNKRKFMKMAGRYHSGGVVEAAPKDDGQRKIFMDGRNIAMGKTTPSSVVGNAMRAVDHASAKEVDMTHLTKIRDDLGDLRDRESALEKRIADDQLTLRRVRLAKDALILAETHISDNAIPEMIDLPIRFDLSPKQADEIEIVADAKSRIG